MPIDVRVEDTELAGFSAPAQTGLKKAGEDYIKKLIAEANRLESVQNSGGGPVEITAGMVASAAHNNNNPIGPPRIPNSTKILRIMASILSLTVGIMYDKEALQSAGYMMAFVIVIAAAIGATFASTWRE